MLPAFRTSVLSLPVVTLAFVACSSTASRSSFDAPAPAADGGAGSSGGTFGTGTTDAASNQSGCAEAAKLVYVLSLEGDLHSFAPAAKKFTKIGALNCRLGAKRFIPISMAVDRKAVAWVNMREDAGVGIGEDTIFKVDTATASCVPTSIRGSMGGMGFSTNDAATDQESLYVIGEGSTPLRAALVKVDLVKQQLLPVADLKESVDLELTGTGDGRLFGFLISSPLALAQVDKATSAFSDRVSLTKLETPQAPMFAFSFWGGDFYFYTATGTGASTTTNVTRYRPSDRSLDTSYMRGIGFHIVGAGVSTCAPTVAPK